jgi:hypothetical protein
MKKTLILIFLFLIFLFSLSTVLTKAASAFDSSSSSRSAVTTYQLPYPGLLPDNPLYILKVVRDRIVRFFISDPLKKGQFDLLQADKSLNSAYYLSFRENINNKMILTAVAESGNSFADSIKDISLAKEQGMDVNGLLENMLLSAQKHRDVLAETENKISPVSKKILEKELRRTRDFEKMVSEIKSKQK